MVYSLLILLSLILIHCIFVLTQKEAVDRFPNKGEIMRGRAIGLSALLEELAAQGTQIKQVDVRQVISY